MEVEEFYSKKHKPNPMWKIFGFLLLAGGASSMVDLEKVILRDKMIIRSFLSKDIEIEYRDIEFVKNSDGIITAVTGKTDVLNLDKLRDKDNFISALERRISHDKTEV